MTNVQAYDIVGNTYYPVIKLAGEAGGAEVATATNQPFIQATPVNNFLPANFRAYTSLSGSATVNNNMFECKSGTTTFGYGAIQSFRSLNYKEGEKAISRFSARFPDGGIASAWQGVGMINLGDELSFGYNGVNFGCWHRHDGKPEVLTLTVTGAASGSEDATLTINGTAYTDVSLTSGSVQHNAYEITEYINDNISGFNADQIDDTVIITADSDGAKGAFSFSSSTATATMVETTTGVTKTSDFAAQDDWNGIELDYTLDPTNMNLYEIAYEYAGNALFYILNPSTGQFDHVHTIRYSNANSTPLLSNPSLHTGLYVASIGSTTDITVQSASLSGFTQGVIKKTRNPRAFSNVKSVGTTMTNIFTIKNKRTVNGLINQQEIEPVQLTLFTESNKGATFEIYGNPTVDGEPNFQNVGSSNLVSLYDTAGTTLTSSNGRLLATYVVPGNSSAIIDLTPLQIRIPPTLRLVIAAKVNSGNAADTGAAMVWYEDV